MPCKYHPASCPSVVSQKMRLFLQHPTGVFLDKAEAAILPGSSGPLDMAHRSAADEHFGAAAQQEDFDNGTGLEVDATFAEKPIRADVFCRSEQVESLSAGACTDELEDYFETNPVIATAFVLRAVDR